MLFQQPVTPVVQIADPPTQDVGVADVLVGSFGLVGVLSLLALLMGLACGGAFILYRRWQEGRDLNREEDEHTRLKLSA